MTDTLRLPCSLLLIAVLAGCATPASHTNLRDIAERNLTYPVVIEGEPAPRFTVAERMPHYGVPQMSVAVVKDNKIAWKHVYGDSGGQDLSFQAASMSKAVAAAGILTFAKTQDIGFDEDISEHLVGMDLTRFNPEGLPITLRGLLAHRNGTTVSGFPGYAADKPMPSTLEVIEGSDNTNTPAVTLSPDLFGTFLYSGGGYQVAQLFTENLSGQRFPELMKELVLDPVGMNDSTFAQPPPAAYQQAHRLAAGHDREGAPVEGQWHRYPEMAAAGLWTTASDYARFAIALMRGINGEEDGIAPDIAQAMAEFLSEDYGMGLGLWKQQGHLVIGHLGANEGFQSSFSAFPDLGSAYVILTNSSAGIQLAREFGRGLRTAYMLPAEPPRVVSRVPQSAELLDALTGSYVSMGPAGIAFRMAPDGNGGLKGVNRQGVHFTLVPVGDLVFVDPQDGQEILFGTSASGTWAKIGNAVFPKVND